MKHLSLIILTFIMSTSLFSQTCERCKTKNVCCTNQGCDSIILEVLSKQRLLVLQDSLYVTEQRLTSAILEKKSLQWQNIIPIIVALIAAFFALLQVKANIITKARVDWIENLRTTASEYFGEVMLLNYFLRRVSSLKKEGKEKESVELYNEKIGSSKKIIELSHKIRLYLNPKEHESFEKKLIEYSDKATGSYDSVQDTEAIIKIQDEIVNELRDILKEAWEDAKSIRKRYLFKFKW